MSTPPPAPPAPPRPVGATFFGWLRGLGVTRRDDAWIAGVCSGIAARTGLDPMLVRGIAIVIAILGGPVFLAYAVGWALLPDARGHIHAESAVNGHFTYPMIFIGIAAVLTFLPFTRGIWFDGAPHIWGMPDWLEITLRTLWVLALIGAGIWLTVAIARRVPRPPAPGAPGPGAAGTAGAPVPSDASVAAESTAVQADAVQSDTVLSTAVQSDAVQANTAGVLPTTGESAESGTADPGATGFAREPGTAGFADSFAAGPASAPGAPTAAAGTADPWGQTAWQRSEWHRERHERAKEEARARADAWKAAHPQAQGAGAAFSSVVLGIALVAAAVVGIGYGAVVPDGKLVLVISLAALAVIAVGIVVAGIRGRRSGGLGPFAVLLAAVVVFTGVLPAGTVVQPFGTQNIDASQSLSRGPDSYLLLAGKSVVDAEKLTAASPDGSVDVWLMAGQTQVLLPANASVRVESHVFAGSVTSSLGTERSGVWIDDDRMFTRTGPPTGTPLGGDTASASAPVIRVWLLAGSVSFVPASER